MSNEELEQNPMNYIPLTTDIDEKLAEKYRKILIKLEKLNG